MQVNFTDRIAAIATSTSGDNTIVAAVAAKKCKVHALRLTAAGTVTVVVKRGSTTLETIYLIAGVPYILPMRAAEYYRTADNEAFILNLSGAVAIAGTADYTLT